MGETLEIDLMLTVSTCHLSQATANQLPDTASAMDSPNLVNWGPAFVRSAGWLFYVPPGHAQLDAAYAGAPKDLLEVLAFACEHGCNWLLFDADGPTVEQLYQYPW